jgi:DNA-binding transcriptional LysR family regulator
MDLNAVSMFVAVVRAGSLSAGAAAMGVPLATLSRRLRQLEDSLNVELVQRSARGVVLTEAGARLYEHASRGVDWLADGEMALRTGQAELSGRLRISIPPTFEPWWEVLSQFQRSYPSIRVSVHVTERQVDLVQDGIDVALRVGRSEDETLVARRLATFRHVLVAAPALIERLGMPTSVQQLSTYPVALWAPNSGSTASLLLGGERVALDPNLSTNDYAHLRRCAEAGEAVTELPEFLARPAIEAGRLVEVLAQATMPEIVLHLLFLQHRHPSSIVRAYLDFCSRVAGEICGGLIRPDTSIGGRCTT